MKGEMGYSPRLSREKSYTFLATRDKEDALQTWEGEGTGRYPLRKPIDPLARGKRSGLLNARRKKCLFPLRAPEKKIAKHEGIEEKESVYEGASGREKTTSVRQEEKKSSR